MSERDMPELPEPAAHIYPSDLERFKESETFGHCYSVAVEALECLSEHGHRCNRCDSEVDEGGKLAAAIRQHLEGRA